MMEGAGLAAKQSSHSDLTSIFRFVPMLNSQLLPVAILTD